MKTLKFRFLYIIFSIILQPLIGVFSYEALGQTQSHCAGCKPFIDAKLLISDQLSKANEMLTKNQQMLEKTPENSTSARIKISSNIFVWTAKIEALNNNLLANKMSADSKKCQPCLN